MLGIATAEPARPRNAARSHLAALVGAYLVLPLVLAAAASSRRCPTPRFAQRLVRDGVVPSPPPAPRSIDPARLAPIACISGARWWAGWAGSSCCCRRLRHPRAPEPRRVRGALGRRVGRGARGAAQITRMAEPAAAARTATRLQLFPIYGGLTLALWVALLIAGDTRHRRALSTRWARCRPAASRRSAGCRRRGARASRARC